MSHLDEINHWIPKVEQLHREWVALEQLRRMATTMKRKKQIAAEQDRIALTVERITTWIEMQED